MRADDCSLLEELGLVRCLAHCGFQTKLTFSPTRNTINIGILRSPFPSLLRPRLVHRPVGRSGIRLHNVPPPPPRNDGDRPADHRRRQRIDRHSTHSAPKNRPLRRSFTPPYCSALPLSYVLDVTPRRPLADFLVAGCVQVCCALNPNPKVRHLGEVRLAFILPNAYKVSRISNISMQK